MSYLQGMVLTPHPPIILPSIGGGEEEKAQGTIEGLKNIAKLVKEKSPQVIICITPHGNVFQDGICILDEEAVEGNFKEFGKSHLTMKQEMDEELIDTLLEAFLEKEVPSLFLSKKLAKEYEAEVALDHGTMVPLHFIRQEYNDFKMVHITIGLMDLLELYEIGTIIADVVEQIRKKTVVLVSGDLSHCLVKGGPYPYNERGQVFDDLISKCIKNGWVEDILLLPEDLAEAAAECGLRPIAMGLGVFDGFEVSGKIFSYEGPFGVGYLNAYLEAIGEGPSVLKKLLEKKHTEYIRNKRTESIPVALARATIEDWVKRDHQLDWELFQELVLQQDIVRELEEKRAGVFVSLEKHGELRGCMGTYMPTKQNIADEIINSSIMAASEDPRFYSVRKGELEDLEIKVDILHGMEEIDTLDQLDVKKYGIFVVQGDKSGLLLPNLDGIETPQQQLEIAMKKAEILEVDNIELYRFEVTRYL
ncbi:AmmeMemoRadiSam system protein A [Alkaliphilus hydrothermalis]|uniref:AmmeMemoRadiSam system protein A/AmmeMemoRadiSam system protein B n=1 Tax=Alkaliphilus hydrothermalis TaxID=1482730 RepID=A0ABS2NQN0_9FIRM|nr:AmmeMemoRadiSam system protein A [Alkaliphilus hydrothermalis]MBM7615192.1 AmmeMemoRadiSam system protein A/AmmeMemoRadiSam system protein B [Alkaliphilus hydrothermalis]